MANTKRLAAAILVYTSRVALGICVGASLVLIVYLMMPGVTGLPINDFIGVIDTAFDVWSWSAAVGLTGLLFARIADRKRRL